MYSLEHHLVEWDLPMQITQLLQSSVGIHYVSKLKRNEARKQIYLALFVFI